MGSLAKMIGYVLVSEQKLFSGINFTLTNLILLWHSSYLT